MKSARQTILLFSILLLSGCLALGCNNDNPPEAQDLTLQVDAPAEGLLAGVADTLDLEIILGPDVALETLEVDLDGVPLAPEAITIEAAGEGSPEGTQRARATLPAQAAGNHVVDVRAESVSESESQALSTSAGFVTVDLEQPDVCEVISSAHCFLPFPSSRFMEDVGAETASGLRLNFPEYTLKGVPGPPLDPTPLNRMDGYSPTVQILAFLENVDLERSNAARLLPAGAPQSTPYVGIRTHDDTSVQPDSPSVLIDADTGQPVLHWVEVDGTDSALADLTRQTLFMRPGVALKPGGRYIVAYRNMVDTNGDLIEPDPVFAALRNGSPTTIDGVESRRADLEVVFSELANAGIERESLQLAFQFQVRSQQQLQERMLAMRDDALGWLAGLDPTDVSSFENIEVVEDNDCTLPDQEIWRVVKGTFDGPYYLTGDIDNFLEVSVLNVDDNDQPVRNGFFSFNWDVAVPCDVFLQEQVGHPLLLGHGFLGDGAGMVSGFAAGSFIPQDSGVSYIAGATDWRGLSGVREVPGLGLGADLLNIALNVIGTPGSGHKFNTFEALPHRLKQGMVNTLVLSKMMKTGFFNRLVEFQRTPGDAATGVFTTPGPEMFYFGVSLGGIYGTMYAALNDDTVRHNVDVPAMNFSLLQQRATPFSQFLALIEDLPFPDPMEFSVSLGIQHELWVSAEPAAYIRHITGTVDEPLPGSIEKNMLVTVAWLDKQVSNQATNIMARSMGIPNLEGSIQAQLVDIPDVNADAGSANPGLSSAMHIYDVGDFDIFDPAYEEYLPALSNRIVAGNCDPHGVPRLTIPASTDQLGEFLKPNGLIRNFCDGACDAQTFEEQPSTPCNPLE